MKSIKEKLTFISDFLTNNNIEDDGIVAINVYNSKTRLHLYPQVMFSLWESLGKPKAYFATSYKNQPEIELPDVDLVCVMDDNDPFDFQAEERDA